MKPVTPKVQTLVKIKIVNKPQLLDTTKAQMAGGYNWGCRVISEG